MIRRILVVTAVLIIIGLIILWLIAGGVGKITAIASDLNPFGGLFSTGTSTGSSRLPWQPDFSTLTDGLATTAAVTDEGTQTSRSDQSKTFGSVSPYQGDVVINDDGGSRESGAAEYIEIQSAAGATTPIDITGWSFESVVTGARAYIPKGASTFLVGQLNAQRDIALDPGVSAIVSTGPSPVGTSFRENECSGYLGQLQQFSPPLLSQCPSPYNAIPIDANNIRTFGDSCLDFLRSVLPCQTPLMAPPTVSPACLGYAQTNFSYNGCATAHQSDQAYLLSDWRVYLGSPGDLWRDTHDVIRLLDAKGRIVDSITY